MKFSKFAQRCVALALLLCSVLFLLPSRVYAANSTVSDGYVTTCRIHYSASSSSVVIGCIPDGTALNVLGEKGSYLKIDCYDMKGYIAKSQTRKDGDGKYYVNCVEGARDTQLLTAFSAQHILELRKKILSTGKKYLGVPYVWGGTTPNGFDCSGYVQYVFRKANISLLRTQSEQLTEGIIIAKEDLQPGDLVFFKNTTNRNLISTHVGIYIGDGLMYHAGTNGIAVGRLNSTYFKEHYLCARRILITDLAQTTAQVPLGPCQNINSTYWRESSQTDSLGTSFLRKIFTDAAISAIISQN